MVPYDRIDTDAHYAGILHKQVYSRPDIRSHLQDLRA